MRYKLVIALMCVCCSLYGQTRFDYFYQEAEKCRLSEKYASALALYQHCLDVNPDASEALYGASLMRLYLRQDSIGTALLQKACSIDSCNPWYLETLASLYLSKRNTEEAIPVLEKMASIQTRRSDVLSQLARIYRTIGQADKAIDVLNRIEMLEGKSAQLSLEKHALYMQKEQKDSAFLELQALCDEFPHDLNYQVIMGNQYLQAGDVDKALAVYDSVRNKDADNLNLRLAMLNYYNQSDMKEQYNRLRDSLLFDPTTLSDLRVTLMRAYVEESERDSTLVPKMQHAFDSIVAMPQPDEKMLLLKAAYQMYVKDSPDRIAETMHQVLKVKPDSEAALSHLLQYYAPKEDYAAIEDICRRGVNSYPEELTFYYYLGISLYQQDKGQETADVFKHALYTKSEYADPQIVSDMYSILGDLYYKWNDPAAAFAAYDSALVYMDNNISCMNNYAYYLSLQGVQLDKAEEMSYRTIKAEPSNITYLDTYAWILFIKGDYTNARIYIEQVVKPQLSDEEILKIDLLQGNLLEHAGDIYIKCGDEENALRFWKLAVKKKDNSCTLSINKKIKNKKYIK